jgi:glycosyltransferase involved in cell wall biosynthesis
MLKAFKAFHDGHPGSTLAILGDGPFRTSLEELTNRMNLTGCVTFLGRSPKVYEFLIDLDAFMLTSRYEGFGMVLLEAMDSGVPILASNNSAIPEVLGDGFLGLCNTGESSDFSSKLEKLCDPKFHQSIIDQQEARLLLFNAETMCKKVAEIYLL